VRAVITPVAAAEFDVVSNPEFLREGVAVLDFMKPDRVVVGTSSARAKAVMERLYKPFVRQGNPIIFMDERSSELTKYAANAFLATKISFMNEIAQVCELTGADVDSVRRGIGTDDRIGKRFLFAGVGYGGSCFPKDVQALKYTSDEFGYPFRIINAVMEVNENQKAHLFNKLIGFFGEAGLKGRKIGIWGLAFKPETDDIREAPALVMIEKLLEKGAEVVAYDPVAMPNVQKYYPNFKVKYASDRFEAATGVDALLIVTEWNEFRTPNLEKLKMLMAAPVIFDGRNLFDLSEMQENGFYYASIGRQVVDAR
jgi:UDPglucose 6-dehydrogenase